MLARAVWSRIGRCALFAVAASALVLAGGCSSNSRFDWPAFNLASSKPEPLPPADPSTTAALPGPQESAYTSGSSVAYRSGGSSLPPGAQAYPSGATPAVYSPPPRPVPEGRPTAHRTPSGGTTIKVAPGDNLYGLSRQYGVSVAAIIDTREDAAAPQGFDVIATSENAYGSVNSRPTASIDSAATNLPSWASCTMGASRFSPLVVKSDSSINRPLSF